MCFFLVAGPLRGWGVGVKPPEPIRKKERQILEQLNRRPFTHSTSQRSKCLRSNNVFHSFPQSSPRTSMQYETFGIKSPKILVGKMFI